MDCPRCGDFNSRLAAACACGHVFSRKAKKPSAAPKSTKAQTRTEEPSPAASRQPAAPPASLLSPARANAAIALFVAAAVEQLAVCAFLATRLLGDEVVDPDLPLIHPAGPLTAFDQGVLVTGGLAVLAFLYWLAGAFRDVKALRPGASLPYSPGGAVLVFFIPIVHFFVPFFVLRALRDATNPDHFAPAPTGVALREAGYRVAPRVAMYGAKAPGVQAEAWFAFWVASRVLPLGAAWVGGAGLAFVVGALGAASALFAVRVVVSVDARLGEQRRRALAVFHDEPVPIEDRFPSFEKAASLFAALAAGGGAIAVLAWAYPDTSLALLAVAAIACSVVTWTMGRVAQRSPRFRSPLAFAFAAALPLTVVVTAARLRALHDSDAMKRVNEAFLEVTALRKSGIPDTAREREALAAKEADVWAKLRAVIAPVPPKRTGAHLCIAGQSHELVLSGIAFEDASAALDNPLDVRSTEPAVPLAARRARADAYARTSMRRRLAIGTHAQKTLTACLERAGLEAATVHKLAGDSVEPEIEAVGEVFSARHAWGNKILAALEVLETTAWVAAPWGPTFDAPSAKEAWAQAIEEERRAFRSLMRALRVVTPRRATESTPLQEARHGFSSAVRLDGSSSPAPPAPIGLVRGSYRGPLGPTIAYVTRPSRDATRRGAVLWMPSIEAFDADLDAASELARRGHVVMLPTVRAELSNPGKRELQLGEIDDVLAAHDHLASLPGVDREQIVVVGVGTGGTRAMLAAASSRPGRGTIAFGGMLDGAALTEQVPAVIGREAELRSAVRFAPHIAHPTFYASGDWRQIIEADEMSELATTAAKQVTAVACVRGAECVHRTLVRLVEAKLRHGGALEVSEEDLRSATVLARR